MNGWCLLLLLFYLYEMWCVWLEIFRYQWTLCSILNTLCAKNIHFGIWLCNDGDIDDDDDDFEMVSYQRTFPLHKYSVCRKTFRHTCIFTYVPPHHLAFTQFSFHQTIHENHGKVWIRAHSWRCQHSEFRRIDSCENELPDRMFIHSNYHLNVAFYISPFAKKKMEEEQNPGQTQPIECVYCLWFVARILYALLQKCYRLPSEEKTHTKNCYIRHWSKWSISKEGAMKWNEIVKCTHKTIGCHVPDALLQFPFFIMPWFCMNRLWRSPSIHMHSDGWQFRKASPLFPNSSLNK